MEQRNFKDGELLLKQGEAGGSVLPIKLGQAEDS